MTLIKRERSITASCTVEVSTTRQVQIAKLIAGELVFNVDDPDTCTHSPGI